MEGIVTQFDNNLQLEDQPHHTESKSFSQSDAFLPKPQIEISTGGVPNSTSWSTDTPAGIGVDKSWPREAFLSRDTSWLWELTMTFLPVMFICR